MTQDDRQVGKPDQEREALIARIDQTVPHSARVWNYMIGGQDWYEVDKELVDRLLAEHPEAAGLAVASREFLARAVRYLVQEAGVDQFLDIGTGLPTADNTHQVAQRYDPEARIVYVDNDPLVLLHARALLTSTPEGATDYAEGDVRDVDTVLAEAGRTLDLDRPVGLVLLSMLGHIRPEPAAELVRSYMDRLASGSYLALCDSIDDPVMIRLNETYAASGAVPYYPRSEAQLAAMAEGLELVEPGLLPIARWRPTTSAEPPADQLFQWGLVARKP
ncbi:SAM-dependent methyltransferase [Streptomyces sp. 3MP-14]|uniref:SAM-dependent methyltransferase n=1 Tax=Streptomyces mimosae TaxID=2586635 RepID=A0A5N6A402_9ACTN|nr:MULTISPECIES: SAM-dependent methyltransferase [Streptomyces]KAB8162128.1 SAM-dependent methyltransferase [Streptomyces mimosae]KAB8173974.1 SAM-dependent methyltransferase [Streptomyces sp. 3MP-14]